MGWIPIDDPHDPRVNPYREIAHRVSVDHRDSFIAEGRWMVERLLASRFQVSSLIVAENRVDQWRDNVPSSVPVYVMHPDKMKELLGYNFHRGVLACGERSRLNRCDVARQTSSTASAISLLVACPRIVNPENLGSIIRSATAFGASAVICGADCADPFSRRAIRVSAGNVFRIPIIQPEDFESELIRLRNDHGYQWLATGPSEGEFVVKLDEFAAPERAILLLGAEDYGLADSWFEQADHRLTIPMSPGTDSLNVAITAAVMLYALTQGSATRPKRADG